MSFETPLPPYNSSDPHATFLNSSCLDLLLIEMVPMAYRIADDLSRRSNANGAVNAAKAKVTIGGGSHGGSTLGGTGAADEGDDGDGEGERRREGAYRRLEGLGYRVGQGIVER